MVMYRINKKSNTPEYVFHKVNIDNSTPEHVFHKVNIDNSTPEHVFHKVNIDNSTSEHTSHEANMTNNGTFGDCECVCIHGPCDYGRDIGRASSLSECISSCQAIGCDLNYCN